MHQRQVRRDFCGSKQCVAAAAIVFVAVRAGGPRGHLPLGLGVNERATWSLEPAARPSVVMIAYRAMFSRRHHCIPTDLHLCVIKVHRVSFISRRILDTDAALSVSLGNIATNWKGARYSAYLGRRPDRCFPGLFDPVRDALH